MPLVNPSMKSAQKMLELKPELEKLKNEHKDDKQKLAKAQLELYQKHGINPAAGFIPMIVQIVVLIALFQAFNQVLNSNGQTAELNKILYQAVQFKDEVVINTKFLYLDLTKPDTFALNSELNLGLFKLNQLPGAFLLSAAVFQYLSSMLMSPTKQQATIKPLKNEKKESTEDMAMSMQKQMTFMMPLLTLFIGMKFPSGLVLYWLTFSLAMTVQQLYQKKFNSLSIIKKTS